jgi:hypothetical protein
MTDPDLDRALADVEAAIDYRLRNLEVTCPGEHEYEPNCTHGANNDPVLKGLRAAAAAVRRLQGERDAAKLAANEEHDRHRETCGELHLMTKRAERAEARQKGTP